MSFNELYFFVRGPLALVAFFIFFVGLIYQIFFFFRNTKKIDQKNILIPLYLQEELKRVVHRRRGIFSLDNDFWTTIITTFFHLFLIIVPLFLLAHNILIEESWNFSFPSLSERLSDIFTAVVLFLGLVLLFRRIFLSKVRAITTFGDFVLFVLVYLPFLTGFLAYHGLYYKPMIIAHIICGEIMLVCIPFTRLRHMLFLLLNRIFIQSEYSFLKAGKRVYGRVVKKV